MENASKALIIAGSVLIAIMIVTVGVYMYQGITQVSSTEAENERIKQIVEYNKQYESFNRKNLYGSDIISLANKVISNNKKYAIEDDSYQMRMQVTIKTKTAHGKFTGVMNETSIERTANIYHMTTVPTALKEDITEFKRKIFKCTGIEYNSINGKKNAGNIIKKMTFEEVPIGTN